MPGGAISAVTGTTFCRCCLAGYLGTTWSAALPHRSTACCVLQDCRCVPFWVYLPVLPTCSATLPAACLPDYIPLPLTPACVSTRYTVDACRVGWAGRFHRSLVGAMRLPPACCHCTTDYHRRRRRYTWVSMPFRLELYRWNGFYHLNTISAVTTSSACHSPPAVDALPFSRYSHCAFYLSSLGY